MGKETVLFASEERTDTQQAAELIRQLAEKIALKQVILRKGENQLVLNLPERLVLEIKVEEELKGDREKRSLEIELEWVEGEGDAPVSLG